MKKKFLLTLMVMVLSVLVFGAISAAAATEGLYTYSVSSNKATITAYDRTVSGAIIIPNTLGGYPVTSIANDAFSYCDRLTSITIPDSVTSIGESAFTHCTNLESITIPHGVTSIGRRTFSSCENLKSITIPDSVTSIAEYAFDGCYSLVSITIPDNVISLGQGAFMVCRNLERITIPSSITSIGFMAFFEVPRLKDVYYEGTEDEWNKITIDEFNDELTAATMHFIQVEQEEYRINEITIKDMSGNSLQAIPTGTFLATVSFANVSSSADTVIILAQYMDDGAFKGLMYIQTEDVPTGSTIKLSIPVDNSKGDVAKLKAFCWESFSSLTPMGNSASFPAE